MLKKKKRKKEIEKTTHRWEKIFANLGTRDLCPEYIKKSQLKNDK